MILYDEPKRTAIAILTMFDDGVVHLLDGPEMDSPSNAAITLTPEFRRLFGDFQFYFEPAGDEQHSYVIDSTRRGILRHRIFPVPRSLYLNKNRTIDPASPWLLAVHHAMAFIFCTRVG